MKAAEKEDVKDNVIHTYAPNSDEERKAFFNTIANLQRENERLQRNCKTHEDARESITKQKDMLKQQIVDLQAQLLASQDRVSELQHKLLEMRRIVNAPIAAGEPGPW
jgi:septal ring factor EnvC (AmiA/AmiB activator)